MTNELEMALVSELEDYLQDKFGADYKIQNLAQWENSHPGFLISSYETPLKYEVTLYSKQNVYPSQLPQLIRSIRKNENDKEISVIGAPKLSKESREYLRTHDFPYVDLVGGFFLRREMFGINYDIEIDRNQTYKDEVWKRHKTQKTPGISYKRISIYRALLINKNKSWGVRELAKNIGLDPGTTSRYLKETVNAGWVEKVNAREHYLVDSSAMLDYWASIAKRAMHPFRLYRFAATDYDTIISRIVDYQAKEPKAYHTLWSGAGFYGHYQDEPFIGLYCPDIEAMEQALGVIKVHSQGANLWVRLVPQFEISIGFNAAEKNSERAVCWQQVYVDLMNAPHRGKSVAAMLRNEMEQTIVRPE